MPAATTTSRSRSRWPSCSCGSTRCSGARAVAPPPERETVDFVLDPGRHAIRKGEREEPLTPTEFRILASLAGAGGEVVRRQALVSAAWPDGAIVHDNTLHVYLGRIRRKLRERRRVGPDRHGARGRLPAAMTFRRRLAGRLDADARGRSRRPARRRQRRPRVSREQRPDAAPAVPRRRRDRRAHRAPTGMSWSATAPTTASLDREAWIFDGPRVDRAPGGRGPGGRSRGDAARAGRARRRGARGGRRARSRAEPVVAGGRRVGTVVVAMSVEGVERLQRYVCSARSCSPRSSCWRAGLRSGGRWTARCGRWRR